MKRIAILMTCFNRSETTLRCLKSIVSQKLPNGFETKIYLVDDGSPDKTGTLVKEMFPNVRVINGNGKLFWTKGMALAWKTAAADADSDYYLWLNDDVTLDKMAVAEVFLGGGTDFVTPMRSAMSLLETGGFKKADVVFITDGECEMNAAYAKQLRKKQMDLGFTVTGNLLDTEFSGMQFSLEPFCQKIYRTSQMMGDKIVRDLMNQRV